MAGVPFIVDNATVTLDERDAWAVLHALRGEGVANDPLGYDIANLIEGALKGSGKDMLLTREQERTVFAALDHMRDTETRFSGKLQRLRDALAGGLGIT